MRIRFMGMLGARSTTLFGGVMRSRRRVGITTTTWCWATFPTFLLNWAIGISSSDCSSTISLRLSSWAIWQDWMNGNKMTWILKQKIGVGSWTRAAARGIRPYFCRWVGSTNEARAVTPIQGNDGFFQPKFTRSWIRVLWLVWSAFPKA